MSGSERLAVPGRCEIRASQTVPPEVRAGSSHIGILRMAPPVKPLRVLVLEDEALILLGMELSLSDAGHQVVAARSVAEALSSLEAGAIDVATLDLRMDGQTLQVADKLLQNSIPFVFCSGLRPPAEPKFRNVPFVGKPFSDTDLITAVERAAGCPV